MPPQRRHVSQRGSVFSRSPIPRSQTLALSMRLKGLRHCNPCKLTGYNPISCIGFSVNGRFGFNNVFSKMRQHCERKKLRVKPYRSFLSHFTHTRRRWFPILWPSARHQPKLWTMDTRPVCRTVCLFTPPVYAGAKLNCLVTEAYVCVCEQLAHIMFSLCRKICCKLVWLQKIWRFSSHKCLYVSVLISSTYNKQTTTWDINDKKTSLHAINKRIYLAAISIIFMHDRGTGFLLNSEHQTLGWTRSDANWRHFLFNV